jgi:hypothetical protein
LSPILGIIASQNYPRITGSYESIATVNVTSATSSITFSSIPSTYKHLQLRYIARASSADLIVFRVNGSTGNDYAIHAVQGNGSAASAIATTSYNYGGVAPIPSTANTFGAGVLDILDYSNTNKYKTFRTLGGREINSTGFIELRSTLYMNTSAISSIVLSTDSVLNFQQYSSFALYGIKG